MSEIRATTISDLVGTGPATLTGQHAAKAWTNLNGTGTIAERDSFNVTSYTDLGTGNYTITIGNDMSDANYASTYGGTGSALNQGGGAWGPYVNAPTAGAFDIGGITGWASVSDIPYALVVVHGDLA